MAKWLKNGKSEKEIVEADAEVKKTVEKILQDVATSCRIFSTVFFTSASASTISFSDFPFFNHFAIYSSLI